jgi:hypothetical protein
MHCTGSVGLQAVWCITHHPACVHDTREEEGRNRTIRTRRSTSRAAFSAARRRSRAARSSSRARLLRLCQRSSGGRGCGVAFTPPIPATVVSSKRIAAAPIAISANQAATGRTGHWGILLFERWAWFARRFDESKGFDECGELWKFVIAIEAIPASLDLITQQYLFVNTFIDLSNHGKCDRLVISPVIWRLGSVGGHITKHRPVK